MRPVLPLILCATMVVTGCSRIADSRINPLNWFGRSQAVASSDGQSTPPPLVRAEQGTNVVDTRGLVGTVTALSVDRTADGAIVRATGSTTAPAQFNAQLVPLGIDAGVLTLAFRVQTPETSRSLLPQPRQITAAHLLSNRELSSIRSVRVEGNQNALISRR